MKLIIQIPCYNEEESLPATLASLPREVPGFDEVEWLVIDDGSTDRTSEVARAHGADHIVRHTRNQGLARTFMTGIHAALVRGADVIVNTDADNQYCADDIPALAGPILAGRADFVVGARPIAMIEHFSPLKKLLQKLGSWVVRKASGTSVTDAPSGFRAISRAAALELNVFNRFTYTLETIIQAGQKNFAITNVPVRVNGVLRPSRLFKSQFGYIRRSLITIIRIFIVYQPFQFFFTLGSVVMLPGILIGLRFLFAYLGGHGQGMIQSLLLSVLFMGAGFALWVTGVLAELIATNRKLLEETRTRVARMEASNAVVSLNVERSAGLRRHGEVISSGKSRQAL